MNRVMNKKTEGFMLSLLVNLFLVVMLFGIFGCAATQTALVHRKLEVQTKMSDTIFLDPVSPNKRTVYIEIKNTSDKDLDLSAVSNRISTKGYKVVNDPEMAHYMLQANVLYVGKASPAAIQEAMSGGYGAYGGLIGGAAIGGLSTDSTKGAVTGGLIGAAAEVVAGSLVKNVTYTIITDVQISERSHAHVKQQTISNLKQGGGTGKTVVKQQSDVVTNWKRYRTRIASTANKVNLKFEEAKPVIVEGLERALSGLF